MYDIITVIHSLVDECLSSLIDWSATLRGCKGALLQGYPLNTTNESVPYPFPGSTK